MLTNPNLQLSTELSSELIENEKLIWVNKPKTGIVFRSVDWLLIPFSLMFLGQFVVFIVLSFTTDFPKIMLLFFLPFMLFGLYVSIGRFITDSKRREKTTYGITQNRIIIISGLFSKTVKSLNIKTIADITIKEKLDGSGTITLGQNDFRFAMAEAMAFNSNKQAPKLEFITDVREVYKLILKLQQPEVRTTL